MSTIEEVIARSRQPGGFSERKRFTVARSRAIQKMREFALADPHYYVLELIQSAVANRARYIDIRTQHTWVIVSYVGGGFAENDLGQLFDFLFASKQDLEHTALRSLAIGVNALLRMEPERILIESGDGTARGTTRLVIRGREDAVDLGRSDSVLQGTFIRADGLRREKIDGLSNLPVSPIGRPRECDAIEQRCMAAPVPFLLNGEAVFGYSSLRTPYLLGYRSVVYFDEGDLYGSLGIPMHDEACSLKLLTSGVWVQSVERAILPRARIGGIVAFDRLRKTADHSGIVQDEMFEQLFVRLRPYAERVLEGGKGTARFNIALLETGERLAPQQLRAVLDGKRFAVIVDKKQTSTAVEARALEIGRALGGPALRVPARELDAVRALGGEGLTLVHPDLENPEELAFYLQPEAKEPKRPWLVAPLEVPALSAAVLERVLGELALSEAAARELVARLGEGARMSARLYTEAEPSERTGGLRVRVLVTGRVIFEARVSFPEFSGYTLVVELEAVPLSRLLARLEVQGGARGEHPCHLIAVAAAKHAAGTIEEASRRVCEGVPRVEPGSAAARIMLAELGQSAELAIAGEPPRIVFRRAARAGAPIARDLFALPLFRTRAGAACTFRDLERRLEESGGVVHGAAAEHDLSGHAPERVLELEREEELILREILGPRSYVRVGSGDADLLRARQLLAVRSGEVTLPAFLDDQGRARTLEELRARASEQGAVVMFAGRCSARPLPPRAGDLSPWTGLAMDPFAYYLLAPILPLRHAEPAELSGQDPEARERRLTSEALAKLARGDLEAGEHQAMLERVLAWAGPRVEVFRRPDGIAGADVSDRLAREILDLPLVRIPGAAPISAQRVLAEAFGAAPLTEEKARVLHALGVNLKLAQVSTAAAPAGLSPVPQDRPISHPCSVAALLERWLEALRPDRGDRSAARDADTPEWDPFGEIEDEPLAVALVEPLPARPGWARVFHAGGRVEDEDLDDYLDLSSDWLHHYLLGAPPRLLVHRAHWLVEKVLAELEQRPSQLAWLLLSAYAHINALFEPVTNAHELIFQRRLARALASPDWPRGPG